MSDIITFFKDIFMIKGQTDRKVGLSQFSKNDTISIQKISKPTKNIKISDLMKRSA